MNAAVRAAVIAVAFMLLFAGTSPALTRDDTLDRGLRANEPYSYSLAAQAREASGDEADALLEQALEHSPVSPGIYFKNAWGSLPNIFASIGYVFKGVGYYGTALWWRLSLEGLILASAIYSLAVTLVIVALMRFYATLPLLLHDINESKAKLLIPLVLLPASFLGPVFFAVAVLILSSTYLRKSTKPVVLLALALAAATPAIIILLNSYYSASTPEARAILAVNEARDNSYAFEILADREDFESRFSYALALKREGYPAEAIDIYKELLLENEDAMVYMNLGNAYIANDQRELGKQAYDKALSLAPQSVLTLYNLSQIYRDELDYSTGDGYYAKAVALDSGKVSKYSALAGKHYNRLVLDYTLSSSQIRRYINAHRRAVITLTPVNPLICTGVAVFMFFFYGRLEKGIKMRAFNCKSCGKVACPNCSDPRKKDHLCHDCRTAQGNTDDGSPQARVARMLSESDQRNRAKNLMRALSFAPPGIAQVYMGRVMSGLLYLWTFSFSITALALNPLFSTGLGSMSHSWLWLALPLVIAGLYAMSFVSVNRRVDRGWL